VFWYTIFITKLAFFFKNNVMIIFHIVAFLKTSKPTTIFGEIFIFKNRNIDPRAHFLPASPMASSRSAYEHWSPGHASRLGTTSASPVASARSAQHAARVDTDARLTAAPKVYPSARSSRCRILLRDIYTICRFMSTATGDNRQDCF
jgi:hypothetical protein